MYTHNTHAHAHTHPFVIWWWWYHGRVYSVCYAHTNKPAHTSHTHTTQYTYTQSWSSKRMCKAYLMSRHDSHVFNCIYIPCRSQTIHNHSVVVFVRHRFSTFTVYTDQMWQTALSQESKMCNRQQWNTETVLYIVLFVLYFTYFDRHSFICVLQFFILLLFCNGAVYSDELINFASDIIYSITRNRWLFIVCVCVISHCYPQWKNTPRQTRPDQTVTIDGSKMKHWNI